MLKLDKYPQVRNTDRDLELPVLYEFLERTKGKIESVIDVGAHYSARYYAHELRNYVKKYHGIDPILDSEVEEIVDRFIVHDAISYVFDKYDLVLCLSTLEHIGMYPIRYEDALERRNQLFRKMLIAAEKYFWISFPVGLAHTVPGEMTIIDQAEFEGYFRLAQAYKCEVGFFFSDGPQAGHPWKQSTKEKCFSEPYIESLGTRAICVMEIEK